MKIDIGEWLEIIGLVIFMVGLFVSFPVLFSLLSWLDYINWQGLGNDVVSKLLDKTLFFQLIHEPGFLIILGLIVLTEIVIILLTARHHPHFRTMM